MDIFPEGMTDPDERDRYLEERDTRQENARAVRDAEVMTSIPRQRATARPPDRADRKAIAARIAYLQLPFRERLRIRLRGQVPAGLIDRHPDGLLWTKP